MIEKVRVAVVGVGNNTSALVQGIHRYRRTGQAVGVRSPEIAGLGVGDVEIVAAFAVSAGKAGRDLHEAIFAAPDNFPRLDGDLPPAVVLVRAGLTDAGGVERVAGVRSG